MSVDNPSATVRTMLGYWSYAREHGETPRAVWAIMGATGLLYWSVSKRHTTKVRDNHHEGAQLVKLTPG